MNKVKFVVKEANIGCKEKKITGMGNVGLKETN